MQSKFKYWTGGYLVFREFRATLAALAFPVDLEHLVAQYYLKHLEYPVSLACPAVPKVPQVRLFRLSQKVLYNLTHYL